MGLSFRTLLNAALVGVPAYQGGQRQAEDDAAKEARQKALDAQVAALQTSTIGEHTAATARDNSEAAKLADEVAHPEKYRTTPAKSETQLYTDYYDGLVASGQTPQQAATAARLRFGKADEHYTPPRDPVADRNAEWNYEVHNPKPPEGVSAADPEHLAKDRREFMQSRITHHIDVDGMSGAQAQAAAEREYLGAQYSAGQAAKPTTAALLSSTVPRSSSSSSAGAGRTGVRAVVSSSTPKVDPSSSTSPKLGTKVLPPGVDKEKYKSDPAYRAFVDANSGS
jgi:hypothetical protein